MTYMSLMDQHTDSQPRLSHLYPKVIFGNNVVIGNNVLIGEGSSIGHNVVIHDDAVLGEGIRVDDGCIIGKLPMRAKTSATTRDIVLPPTTIGDESILGSHVIVYRGASIGRGVLLADLSSVREETCIGELTIIGRGVAVENQVVIGKRCKVETGAYITAMSKIADFCFIAPEVTFTNDNYVGRSEERFKHFGGVTMDRGSRVGANVTVLPGIHIGQEALVGAGSVVTKPVEPFTVVFGSPARPVYPVPHNQRLAPEAPIPTSPGGL